MTVLPIIAGVLVGIVGLILVGVLTAVANVISISGDALWATKKKLSRKATPTYSRVGTDATVIKLPERRTPDAEVRRAA